MHKIILISVILFSSIFAETLYLKNMTKIKATDVEIVEENVEYTLGRYGRFGNSARNNIIKKTDIIAILYEDGSIYAVDESIDEKLILEKIEEIEIKEKETRLVRQPH